MPGGFLPVVGVIQRSFGGGELAPALHARADEVKYATGLRTCRNFFIRRSGGVSNRAGFRFITECATASPTVQLIPFYGDGYNVGPVLIECGAGYLRFIQNDALVTLAPLPAWSAVTNYAIGDLVLSGGINYYATHASLNQVPPNAAFWYPMPADILEIPTGFAGDLPYWSQDNRTLTLTHQLHHPQELINLGTVESWLIRDIVTTPAIAPPVGLVLTPGVAGTRRFAYVVTAAGPGFEESIASGVVIDGAVDVPTPDTPHVLTWTAVPGAEEYYVYLDPYDNGVYGFIGTTPATTFNDVGFVPDFTVTPPLPVDEFPAQPNFPAVSTSYQQRRVFGATSIEPQEVFASRIGFPSNFTISSPLQDDDAITFKLASWQAQPVRHLIGLKQLIVLTDRGEWVVLGDQGGALTPASINADQQGYAGVGAMRPVVIGNSIIYVQAAGNVLRDIRFDQQVEGLAGKDVTLFSSHLFDGHVITKIDFAQVPHSIVWAVRDDGVLLGMTYIRELEVWGWTRHDTQGWFHDVAVLPGNDEDQAYVIVRRTVNAATVRYIEKLEKREYLPANFDTQAFFVDSGLSYSGAPVNNVTGLDHLENEVVAVVGDGAVIFDGDPTAANAGDFTVTGGTLPVVLPASYSNIHVGLRYSAEIETLDLDVSGGDVREKQKGVGPVQLLIHRSSRTFRAGPDLQHLRTFDPPGWEPTADEFTGQVEMNTTKELNRYGRVVIRQDQPLPLTILAVVPNVELGG